MGAFDDIISAFGGKTSTPAPVAQTFAQIKLRPGKVQRSGPDFDMAVKEWNALLDEAVARYGPKAQTRITRTPVYTVSGEKWPDTKAGEFDPSTGRINIKDEDLQNSSGWILPHESAHAIFEQAGFGPASKRILQGMKPGGNAMQRLSSHPELYGSSPLPETIANEGLAYSIPLPSGGPYVNYMAGLIKDPALAQQLQRLHQNATAQYSSPMQLMEKLGSTIQELFTMPPIEKDH